jgi:molybdenum ABC transporter molybdate-binding protein
LPRPCCDRGGAFDFFISFIKVIVGFAVLSSASLATQAEQTNPSETAVQLTIAEPAELNPTITQLARAFEQKNSKPVQITVEPWESRRSPTRKAPVFDALFSPDTSELHRLAASGALLSSSVREVARDQLVICVSPLVRVEFPPRNPLLGLKEKAVSSIAIPDPRTVYGKAAKQALKSIKVYSPVVAEKLAVGKDLSDVAQLMERGDASAAILPKSALQTYSLRGTRVIPIAQSLYPPIHIGAAVSRRSEHKQEAIQFLRFAVSPNGQEVFRQSGFSESKSPARKP